MDLSFRTRPFRELSPVCFFPFLASLLILFLAGLSVHFIRSSMGNDKILRPVFPRAGQPFRINMPASPSGTLSRRVIFQIEKDASSPYVPGRWPTHGIILRLPIQLEPKIQSLRITLMDAGAYSVTIRDRLTGAKLESRKIRIVLPSSHLGNIFFLLLGLGGAGALSALFAGRHLMLPSRIARSFFFLLLLEISVIFVFGALSENPRHPKNLFFHTIGLKHAFISGGGLLTIRQKIGPGKIGDWDNVGKEPLLFSGRIDRTEKWDRPLFLAAGLGKVSLTFVAATKKRAGLRIFEDQFRPEGGKRSLLPSMTRVPFFLYFGLVLFSGAIFLRLLPVSERRNEEKTGSRQAD